MLIGAQNHFVAERYANVVIPGIRKYFIAPKNFVVLGFRYSGVVYLAPSPSLNTVTTATRKLAL